MEIPKQIKKYSPLLDLATGLAVLLLFATATPGTIPKLAIVLLTLFGSCSIAYHSIEKKWITFDTNKRKVISALVLFGIVGAFTSLAVRIWPVEPYCYFVPIFGPMVNTDAGLKDAFLLQIYDPTDTPLEEVKLNYIIEKYKRADSMEEQLRKQHGARSCDFGHVRAKEPTPLAQNPSCVLLLPVGREEETDFYLDIYTRDASFDETIYIRWDGKQWQYDFELQRILRPGVAKTIVKMKSRH